MSEARVVSDKITATSRAVGWPSWMLGRASSASDARASGRLARAVAKELMMALHWQRSESETSVGRPDPERAGDRLAVADLAFFSELACDVELLRAMDRFSDMVETNAPEWERQLAELSVRQQRLLDQLG